ncbi:MAG: hypothetical protein AAGE84_23370 [Cyanobacteria bacterium P01_G01_bin.39]
MNKVQTAASFVSSSKVGKTAGYAINYALQLGILLSFTNVLNATTNALGAAWVFAIYANLFPSTSHDMLKLIINDICQFITGDVIFLAEEWETIPGRIINYVDGVPIWVENVDNPELVGKVATQYEEEEVIPQTDESELTNKKIAHQSDVRIFNFPAYGNPFANTKLTVEYSVEDKTIRWNSGESYKFNERLVRVQKNFGFEVDPYIFTVVNVNQVIAEILATVAKKPHMKAAQTFLQGLVGTVLVSDWECADEHVNNYNLAAIQPNQDNLVDAQRVLRDSEVAAYHINKQGHIILKKDRDQKTAWVEGCLRTASKEWGFALPDKTNTKRAFVGDALGIMGVSADGRISMVEADKGGKFFNRHAMVKHISAEVANPEFDALVAEISGTKFAASYGSLLNSLFVNSPLLSLAVGDGGFVVRNPLTFTVNKRIDGKLNIDLLFASRPEYKAHVQSKVGDDRNAQVEFIMAEMKEALITEYEGKVIAPAESIEFQGQTILTNTSNLELVAASTPKVRKGNAINTEIRTIAVTLQTKATITDYNHKSRGQWFKGMATRNDDVVITPCSAGECAGSEAEVIFNDNSVKNRKAMLIRMWANASGQMVSFCKDGEFRLVDFNEETKLYELGEVVDFAKVQADLDSKFGKSVTVSLITTAKELAAFKAADEKAFTGVREQSLNNGLVRIEFVAQAIESPLVFAVELSSVAENFSPNRKVAPIQSAFLATFDAARSTATKTIKKHSKKVARTIELSASTKVDAHFDLRFAKTSIHCCQHESLVEILTKANKNHNPRDMFRALAQKFPNGFKVSGSTAEATRHWTISIPTHILSVQGGFDKNGWSFDDKVTDTYAFLCLLADKASCPQLIADYAMGLKGALDGWRTDVVTSKKAFTKGSAVFDTHGMKVLSNPIAGFETHGGEEIPVILVDESNPLVNGTAISKDAKVAKTIADGDVVFFYRNPMIDVTPAIIRITKDQTVCGKFTCAVAPSVLAWSSQTDNDGDVLWVIPAKQVSINNVDNSAEDSARAGSLMNHSLVGNSLAESTMTAFGCDNLLKGIIKARPDFSVKNPTHKVAIDVVAEAEKVANHYRIRVGQGYAAMFNAYASFIRQANNGYVFSNAELQGIKGCSFVLYEEWGLAGFSEENETNFKAIRHIAKGQLGLAKKVSRSNRFKKSNSGSETKEQAARYVAQHIIQSKIERSGNVVCSSIEAKAIKEEALSNGLFRSLTKGAFSFSSSDINPIFKGGKVDVSNPFAEALTSWQSFAANGLVIA